MSYEAHAASSGEASWHSKAEAVLPFMCFSILLTHTSVVGHIPLMYLLIDLSFPLTCKALDNRKLIYFIFEYLDKVQSLTNSTADKYFTMSV